MAIHCRPAALRMMAQLAVYEQIGVDVGVGVGINGSKFRCLLSKYNLTYVTVWSGAKPDRSRQPAGRHWPPNPPRKDTLKAAHRPSPQFNEPKTFRQRIGSCTPHDYFFCDRLQPLPPPTPLLQTDILDCLQIPQRKQPPSPAVKMSAPQLNKIAPTSPSRQNPSELETSIAGALYDLETNTADLKVALRPLQFVSAKEV